MADALVSLSIGAQEVRLDADELTCVAAAKKMLLLV